MKLNMLKMTALALMLLLGASTADAQFGSLKARVKNSVEQKARQKASQVANPSNIADEIESAVPEKGDAQSKIEFSVNGHNYKLDGKINHQNWSKHQKSTITFTNVPATIEEFKKVRDKLGREPQGAVALQIMAFEMYRRDPALGAEALQLNNTSTNYSSTMRQLKQVMNEDDPSYARPYLAAALLQGAKNTNAYTPKYPYEAKIQVNPVTKYQESEILDGTVIYLQVISEGWDTNQRGVEVVRPDGEDYYVVSNCPAMYTQCKKIKGTFQGLK